MSDSRQIDTLNLISIQHELAMNIGLDPQLVPMVRHLMKVCLRRLSVRRAYLFLRIDEDELLPAEATPGPENSVFFAMPADRQAEILDTPQVGEWIVDFFRGSLTSAEVTLFQFGRQFVYAYPLADNGVLLLDRSNTPLPDILVGALTPVFERLRQGCEAAIKHEQIIHEVERRRVAERRIQHLAFHDDLTGLPNRRHLLKQLNQLCERHVAGQGHCALIYLGLDNFSDINESLGYQIGDAVLGAISKRIVLADEKLAATARLDGDEFGFLITDLSNEESAASERVVTLTRWLLLQIEQPCELDDRTVSVAASAGITVFKADAEQPQAVLSHGRSALRRAKSLGRNTIHLHDTSLDEETSQRLSLDYDMRSALKSGDFQLWLQPQVDQQGRIIGAETLIRWNHADKGLLLPNSFIPMAEKSGFIVPLSEWVLNEACRLIKLLNDQAVWPAGAKLGVNLSAKQFHQPDFVNRVLTTIKERNVSAEQIELELTERTLLDNVEEAIEKMQQLREAGLQISIDDFGTGYSSLAYLRRLPINRVKIDRAFVANIDSSTDDQAIVEVIISIARHFDMQVIAEGIDRPEALQTLVAMGCHQFQGYLFHRPMPLESFLELS
ncbi:MAG: bifunctional diguanylate cyclase/phosphodiesterase [Candidatus Thiodiazotropha taylori]|nr:bifunctional diguanylate cyclase/phosphodiesterase [Candidatus Thiodiazotropha taylori]